MAAINLDIPDSSFAEVVKRKTQNLKENSLFYYNIFEIATIEFHDEEEIWSQERVTEIIQLEIKSNKAAKGMKLLNPLTRVFSNPLDWWRINESNFPYLAKLALKYLSIPATSAPSE